MVLDHRFQVALVQQALPPEPVGGGPVVGLALVGDGGLQGHAGVLGLEVQDGLAEVEVCALGHAAEKVAVAPVVGLGHGAGQPGLDGLTAQIGLIVSPGQALGAVAGEAAGDLRGHGASSPFGFRAFHTVCSLWYTGGCRKSTKTKRENLALWYRLVVAFFPEEDIIESDNEIRCLQGGVKVPTGGTVRERLAPFEKQEADPVRFRDRQ